MDGIPKINLPSFGMASYKFKGSSWKENGANELQLANSLLQAAENWLKLLQVNHPDFQFFASNGYHREENRTKEFVMSKLETIGMFQNPVYVIAMQFVVA
ncbi:hypothetical protein HS088_TW15G00023 [Tripterygium wilfordii]|uniref:Uncharacterized protein n=1 Tax=Tripterygium wilfordii TaxID=458696 RepID=A0A7J7CKI8_TRIWF|nr:hypothetical protein HS088_TW15G00023 [Tripterygium wilfordii]